MLSAEYKLISWILILNYPNNLGSCASWAWPSFKWGLVVGVWNCYSSEPCPDSALLQVILWFCWVLIWTWLFCRWIFKSGYECRRVVDSEIRLGQWLIVWFILLANQVWAQEFWWLLMQEVDCLDTKWQCRIIMRMAPLLWSAKEWVYSLKDVKVNDFYSWRLAKERDKECTWTWKLAFSVSSRTTQC